VDSISRSGLLSLLQSKVMTQDEFIALVQSMAPLEPDKTTINGYYGNVTPAQGLLGTGPDYQYTGLFPGWLG
jgi:hypothetical protein